MIDRDGRVGKGVDDGLELFEVLRALEHPACSPSQPLQRAQDLVHVPIVRSLVALHIIVTEGGTETDAHVLQKHRREVDREQMNLFVSVVDRHLVHRVEVGHGEIAKCDPRCGAFKARVRLSCRGFFAVGKHRFECFPPGQFHCEADPR